MTVRHTFAPTVTLIENGDGTYTMTVDFFDSWESSRGPNNRSMDDSTAAVNAACAALDAYLAAHPRITGPVKVYPPLGPDHRP